MSFIFTLLDRIPGVGRHKRVIASIVTGLIQGLLFVQKGMGQEWIDPAFLNELQMWVGAYAGLAVVDAARKRKANGVG